MSPPQADQWYFGVKCGNLVVIAQDPHGGKSGFKFAGPGKLRATCQKLDCQHQDDYLTNEVVNFQVIPPAQP
jgi:hypothetical protein